MLSLASFFEVTLGIKSKDRPGTRIRIRPLSGHFGWIRIRTRIRLNFFIQPDPQPDPEF